MKILGLAMFALVLALPAAAAAKSVPTPAQQEAINNQAAVSCNLCFTCGGDWPIFAGAFTTRTTTTVERGGLCSGSLISRLDSQPFLCCN